jgi:hypothetical protein
VQQGVPMRKRQAFRRTRRTALAVGGVTLATFLATTPGGAAPQQDAFNNGTGSATALGYKVNPTNGNLSFGITAGESVAGHQNTGATGQSRAVNMGVIGVTLAGEGCDGGDPTMPAEDQPQPVIVRSTDENAAEGQRESEQGLIEKFARATPAPYAEAITTISPLGDPAAIYVNGGRTVTHSGVINGNVREALARTELGSVVIGGGAVELQNLSWEAVHRSGAVEETIGTFNMGNVLVNGQVTPLPGDGTEQLNGLKDLLKPLGLTITPPKVRVEEGIVFVDALKIGIIQSQERDSVVGPIFSGAQPVRAALTEALLEADCGNASYITVADVALGSFSGAGELTLELGGVQATTAEIDAFEFTPLPPLPDLPALGGGLGGGGIGAVPSGSGSSIAAPAPEPATAAAPESSSAADSELDTQPISDLVGERGGWMALVGGGGLAALLATAEADRRKMRHALREIPLEA